MREQTDFTSLKSHLGECVCSVDEVLGYVEGVAVGFICERSRVALLAHSLQCRRWELCHAVLNQAMHGIDAVWRGRYGDA